MSFRIINQKLDEYRSALLRGDLTYVLAAVHQRMWVFDRAITVEQRRITVGFLDQVAGYLGRKPEADPVAALAVIERAREYWSTGRPRA